MVNFKNKINYISNSVNTAYTSLMLHKLRTLLSLIGIVCGVMVVLSIMAIGEGAKLTALKQIEQMGATNIFIQAAELSQDQKIRSSGLYTAGLTISDLQRLNHGCRFIIKSAGLIDITAQVAAMPSQLTPKIIGCTSQYGPILHLQVSSGRFLSEEDDLRKNLICVLGWEVSEILGNSGKKGQSIRIGNNIFKIVGILKHYNALDSDTAKLSMQNINEMIFLPLNSSLAVDEEDKKQPSQNQGLSELIVEINKKENVPIAADIIRRIMSVSHHGVEDYRLVVPLELLSKSLKLQRIFNIVFGTVGVLSLIIGGIGIMNIMLAGVSERTREIGLRIAVGATKRHIAIQFLVEAVLITITGGIIGVVAGYGATGVIAYFAGWPVKITFTAVIIPLVVSVTIGLFFGLYPATRAARLDPIKALSNLA